MEPPRPTTQRVESQAEAFIMAASLVVVEVASQVVNTTPIQATLK